MPYDEETLNMMSEYPRLTTNQHQKTQLAIMANELEFWEHYGATPIVREIAANQASNLKTIIKAMEKGA